MKILVLADLATPVVVSSKSKCVLEALACDEPIKQLPLPSPWLVLVAGFQFSTLMIGRQI